MTPDPLISTNTAIILATVIYALVSVLNKVVDWKVSERRRPAAASVEVAQSIAVVVRLEHLEAEFKHVRESLHALRDMLNVTLGRLSERVAVLEADATRRHPIG